MKHQVDRFTSKMRITQKYPAVRLHGTPLEKLALDIEHRIRHNLMVIGPKTTAILAAQSSNTPPTVVKHCAFCHDLNTKGIKLHDTQTNFYDKLIPYNNHTIEICTLKLC